MIELLFARIASPLGTLLVVAGPQILYALDFAEFEDRMLQRLRQRLGGFLLIQAANPLACRDRLQAYFAGEVDCLNSIPVDPAGTPFQQQVWSALRSIPAGATLSYGQLAAQLGRPLFFLARFPCPEFCATAALTGASANRSLRTRKD